MEDDKAQLRTALRVLWADLWPVGEADLPLRPPEFVGCNKAAELLRRQPAYQKASVLAVMADPALLQVRINALQDGKTLIAATPGLKQGLVRITPQGMPLPRRSRELRGGALFQAGKPLRLPQARLKKVDLVVGTALASDPQGLLLGDGRGLLDLLVAVLQHIEALPSAPAVVALLAEQQLYSDNVPQNPWDQGADVVITPRQTVYFNQPVRPMLSLSELPSGLKQLPIVKALLA